MSKAGLLIDVLEWEDSEKLTSEFLASLLQFYNEYLRQKLAVKFRHLSFLNDDSFSNPEVSRCLLTSATNIPALQEILAWKKPSLEEIVNFGSKKFKEQYVKVSITRTSYSPEEMETLSKKILDAIELLNEVGCGLLHFVDSLTLQLEVWKEGGVGYGSTSTGDWFGRTILRNAHKPEFTVEEIAECLVHEAIHHALNIIELDQPIVKDQRIHQRKTLSRWSGNTIGTHSFVHACYVWFGLYNFYRRLCECKKEKTSFLEKRRNYCARGFVNGNSIAGHLNFVMAYVDQNYLVLLEQMRTHVITQSRFLGRPQKISETLHAELSNYEKKNIYTAVP